MQMQRVQTPTTLATLMQSLPNFYVLTLHIDSIHQELFDGKLCRSELLHSTEANIRTLKHYSAEIKMILLLYY